MNRSGTGVEDAVTRLDRRTRWELVRRLPLSFPTFHPQGLAFDRQHTFLSSVQVMEDQQHGAGHVFVLNGEGTLVRDIRLGDGAIYHPGGICFDGNAIWVPVAEYVPESTSMIVTVAPESFTVRERFRVPDHIGWVVSDPETGTIYGGSWGSRRFYAWSENGRELDRWDNPSSFIDYQDCQYASDGHVLCGGISILPSAHGDGAYELGGIALIDFPHHRIVHEAPVPVFSRAGHVVTRNPFALTMEANELFLHVAPDNGTEGDGSELLVYRAARLTA